MEIVTRFAPSPTGHLHIGHAFAALSAYKAARAAGGRFLLRIEDIDAARCKPEFELSIHEDLAWLGLSWELPVRRQSEHFACYRAALERLAAQGLLYPCFCTRKEIADEIARSRAAPHGPDGPAYPGTCRMLTPGESAKRMAESVPYALRLDIAKACATLDGPPSFVESGRGPDGETGEQTVCPERLGDVVLARKDMPTSYHLAVVCDDAAQGVTLVTRGEDLFAATFVQRLLQALLNFPVPAYAHHRLIFDALGRKFSKRDAAATLRDLRARGVTPEEIRKRVEIG